ncbi:MAG TPA: hypothetical protein VFX61_17850 [Micromonosporaceae bacterium]|nr:hypothetical protein [Micromonosporaceae bacterium]
MVKALTHRFILGAALLGVLGAQVLPGAAQAAPASPTAVTISGDELTEPLTIEADSHPELFTAILEQVKWLRSGAGNSGQPKASDLGPKYTVVVLVEAAATQTYDLYPLAAGGPRAFRPAKQPDKRKTSAAWFFGRLTMPEALRAAGVPLPDQPDVVSGGIGGGGERLLDDDLDPAERVDQLVDDLRRLVLLNGAVVLAIAVGLAGISLLIRRRTR